jgi:enterochelin esterase-like enzyme
LSQSGAFAWWPGYSDHQDPARELTRDSGWLQRQFATTSKLPVRFYLDAGSWETTGTLLTNRQFRDLLGAMAYPVTYREYIGGHEHLMWRSTLSDGLKALSGDNAARATELEKPAD